MVTGQPNFEASKHELWNWNIIIFIDNISRVKCYLYASIEPLSKRNKNRKIIMCPLELEGGDLPRGLDLFFLLSVIKRRHFSPFEVKGGISYIPRCIASYYIIKLSNARDPISSTGTRQLNDGGKRLVMPIKPSVPLLCRSIYDFRFTIPTISLVKPKRVFWPPIIS